MVCIRGPGGTQGGLGGQLKISSQKTLLTVVRYALVIYTVRIFPRTISGTQELRVKPRNDRVKVRTRYLVRMGPNEITISWEQCT